MFLPILFAFIASSLFLEGTTGFSDYLDLDGTTLNHPQEVPLLGSFPPPKPSETNPFIVADELQKDEDSSEGGFPKAKPVRVSEFGVKRGQKSPDSDENQKQLLSSNKSRLQAKIRQKRQKLRHSPSLNKASIRENRKRTNAFRRRNNVESEEHDWRQPKEQSGSTEDGFWISLVKEMGRRNGYGNRLIQGRKIQMLQQPISQKQEQFPIRQGISADANENFPPIFSAFRELPASTNPIVNPKFASILFQNYPFLLGGVQNGNELFAKYPRKWELGNGIGQNEEYDNEENGSDECSSEEKKESRENRIQNTPFINMSPNWNPNSGILLQPYFAAVLAGQQREHGGFPRYVNRKKRVQKVFTPRGKFIVYP